MYACADRIGSPTSLVWLKCHLTYKQTTYWGWILPLGLKSLNKSTRPGSGSHPNSIGSDGQTLCRDWVSAIVSLHTWSLFKLSGHKFLWSLPFPELIFAFWISAVLWNFEVRWGSRVFGSVPDHTRPWEMNWKEWSFWELFKSTKPQQVCLSWTLGLQSVSRTQGTMFSQGKTWQHNKTCPFLPRVGRALDVSACIGTCHPQFVGSFRVELLVGVGDLCHRRRDNFWRSRDASCGQAGIKDASRLWYLTSDLISVDHLNLYKEIFLDILLYTLMLVDMPW